jgi:hypothetical protein
MENYRSSDWLPPMRGTHPPYRRRRLMPTQPMPVPNTDDRVIALALIRAVADERPEDCAAIWRPDREVEVGQAGIAYAALLARQLVDVLRDAGAKVTVSGLVDSMIEDAVRPQNGRGR